MSQHFGRGSTQFAGAVVLAAGLAGVACIVPSGFAGEAKATVDRTHKGDRLSPAINRARPENKSTTMNLPRLVPLGCDPAFSPVAEPQRARIFGRCIT